MGMTASAFARWAVYAADIIRLQRTSENAVWTETVRCTALEQSRKAVHAVRVHYLKVSSIIPTTSELLRRVSKKEIESLERIYR